MFECVGVWVPEVSRLQELEVQAVMSDLRGVWGIEPRFPGRAAHAIHHPVLCPSLIVF